MLSIAIYSDIDTDIADLRSMIQDFLIEHKIMAKVYHFNDKETFITTPNSFDIYIMNMDSAADVLDIGKQMYNIDIGSKFIYLSSNPELAHKAAKVYVDYFLLQPIDKKEFNACLLKIKKNIQDDSIIIKMGNYEKRIRANHLNYINIEKRCLCYHLKDGTMFDGQTLRTSFEKAINPLQNHPGFLFLAPSLLINTGEIKELYNDHLVFENDEILYFPRKAYDLVSETWKNFSRILN